MESWSLPEWICLGKFLRKGGLRPQFQWHPFNFGGTHTYNGKEWTILFSNAVLSPIKLAVLQFHDRPSRLDMIVMDLFHLLLLAASGFSQLRIVTSDTLKWSAAALTPPDPCSLLNSFTKLIASPHWRKFRRTSIFFMLKAVMHAFNLDRYSMLELALMKSKCSWNGFS